MEKIRFISLESTSPYHNLAAEEFLLKQTTDNVLMLWRNENTVVVGRHQNTAAEINQEYVESHHVNVVRRLTGGGAVFHDAGNLNFTFIRNLEPGRREIDFRRYLHPIVGALRSLGVPAEFTGRNDLAVNGQKISGNAMTFHGNRVLEHGTLLFSSQMADVAAALNADPDKFRDKAVKSVRSRVTNISDHLSRPMSVLQFRDYLMDYLMKEHPLSGLQNLNHDEEAEVVKLADGKYATWEWNYGTSPDYSLNRKIRTGGGTVQAVADIRHGLIRDLRLYGDFFAEKDIGELVDNLIGTPFTKADLVPKLAVVDQYLHHVTCDDMIQLFFS